VTRRHGRAVLRPGADPSGRLGRLEADLHRQHREHEAEVETEETSP
jgi:hypothetical protein